MITFTKYCIELPLLNHFDFQIRSLCSTKKESVEPNFGITVLDSHLMTEDEVLCFEDVPVEFGRRDGEGVEDDEELRLIKRKLRNVKLVSGVLNSGRFVV